MAKFDTIIRGGHVANGSESLDYEIGIRGGRVAAPGEDLGSAVGSDPDIAMIRAADLSKPVSEERA